MKFSNIQEKYVVLAFKHHSTDTMKRVTFLIALLLPVLYCLSKNPEYKEVTEKFITTYKYPVRNGDKYRIYFAKKKDGWFVYKYYYQETENKERDLQLFWSNAEQKYNRINFSALQEEEKSALNVDDERTKYTSQYSDYNYERCIYAGYINWDIDIIHELENKKELNEQELESLARAYSNYAMGFLLAVHGTPSDYQQDERKELDRCAIPTRKRAEKFAEYIHKGIAVCNILKEKNPSFQTLVGDIQTKLSGEYLYAFTYLTYVGYDDLAAPFLKDSLYDDYILTYAKNYLKFLKKDAILFTQGDVDTYPLIYVQEKLGFRKDVIVLNVGQLQLPAYLNYQLQKHPDLFPASFKNFYCCNNSDYVYLSDNTENLSSVYINLLLKKLTELSENCADIKPAKPLFDTRRFETYDMSPETIELPDFMYLCDLAEFMIVLNNLHDKPVYYGNTVSSPMQYVLYPYTSNKGMASEILRNSRPEEYPINTYEETAGHRGYNTVDTASIRIFLKEGDFKVEANNTAIKTNSQAIELLYLQYASQLMQYVKMLIEEKQLQAAREIYNQQEELFYFNTQHISYHLAYPQIKLLTELKLFDKASNIILTDIRNIETQTKTIDETNASFRRYFISQMEDLIMENKFPDKLMLLSKIKSLKTRLRID